MSYIAFLEVTFCIAVGHIFHRFNFFDVDVFRFFKILSVQNIDYMKYLVIEDNEPQLMTYPVGIPE